MKIYLAIGGNQKVFDFVLKHDLGWCMAPDNARNPKGRPYFLDNGAFNAWKDGTNWEEVKFKSLINRYPDYDFFVYPDIVGGGLKSLYRSLNYVGTIPGKGYLAVQEGMLANNVMEYVDAFDGLFIGGASLSWKFSTAHMWADLAHLHGKKCHAGRVGTWEGLVHMHCCGVDSVDSSTASRHCDDHHIRKYFDFLKNQKEIGAF